METRKSTTKLIEYLGGINHVEVRKRIARSSQKAGGTQASYLKQLVEKQAYYK